MGGITNKLRFIWDFFDGNPPKKWWLPHGKIMELQADWRVAGFQILEAFRPLKTMVWLLMTQA